MKNAVISVIFKNKQQEVLLVRRRDMDLWVLPGGGIEDNEDAQNGVIRETFEETGLNVRVLRKVGEYTPISRLASFTNVFECQILEGQLSTGEETRNINFFPINQLPSNFFHIHKEWLEDALLNSNEIICKPISGATPLKLFIYFLKHPIRVFRGTLARLGFPINSR